MNLNLVSIFRGTFRWYSLKSKPGKKDEKYRGEIEVKVTFIVQSKSENQSSMKISRAGSIKHLASSVGTLCDYINRCRHKALLTCITKIRPI